MTSGSSEPVPEGFRSFEIRTGPLLEIAGVRAAGLAGGTLALPADATHYGMVTAGTVGLESAGDRFRLRAGMFFVVPGAATIASDPGEGIALVISRDGYAGLRQIGGPIEPVGRLRYIDGCTDTLLVSPPRLGDPCLNHLHLPAHTDQSAHTHPSVRIGAILGGSGECRTGGRRIPLSAGLGWAIEPGCRHSFATESRTLDVIAWHPDSDFGPTDTDHPMVNRTIL